MIEYLKLLNPKTPTLNDKLLYYTTLIFTLIRMIPDFLIRRRSFVYCIWNNFPKSMPSNIKIYFNDVIFNARRGQTDILMLNDLSEPWMKEYFNPKPGDIVIDVGAHVGKYTIPSSKLVGNAGLVISIEASPKNYTTLLENISINKVTNVVPINLAAGNEIGEGFIYGWDDLYSLHKKFDSETRVPVKISTIDSILQNHNITRVDWVKIDVEGAEIEVLEGMKNTIKNNNLHLIIEIELDNIHKVDELLKDYTQRDLSARNPEFVYKYYSK